MSTIRKSGQWAHLRFVAPGLLTQSRSGIAIPGAVRVSVPEVSTGYVHPVADAPAVSTLR